MSFNRAPPPPPPRGSRIVGMDPVTGKELAEEQVFARVGEHVFESEHTQLYYLRALEQGLVVQIVDGKPQFVKAKMNRVWALTANNEPCARITSRTELPDSALNSLLKEGKFQFAAAAPELKDSMFAMTKRREIHGSITVTAKTGQVIANRTFVLTAEESHFTLDFNVTAEQEPAFVQTQFKSPSLLNALKVEATIEQAEIPGGNLREEAARVRRQSNATLRPGEFVVELERDAKSYGFTVGWDPQRGVMIIKSLNPVGSAARSKVIQVGDAIRAVQGERVQGLEPQKIQEKLRNVGIRAILVLEHAPEGWQLPQKGPAPPPRTRTGAALGPPPPRPARKHSAATGGDDGRGAPPPRPPRGSVSGPPAPLPRPSRVSHDHPPPPPAPQPFEESRPPVVAAKSAPPARPSRPTSRPVPVPPIPAEEARRRPVPPPGPQVPARSPKPAVEPPVQRPLPSFQQQPAPPPRPQPPTPVRRAAAPPPPVQRVPSNEVAQDPMPTVGAPIVIPPQVVERVPSDRFQRSPSYRSSPGKPSTGPVPPVRESTPAEATLVRQNTPPSASEFGPEYAKYVKMKRAGLPDGAIINAMNRDGVVPPPGFFPDDFNAPQPVAIKITPTASDRPSSAPAGNGGNSLMDALKGFDASKLRQRPQEEENEKESPQPANSLLAEIALRAQNVRRKTPEEIEAEAAERSKANLANRGKNMFNEALLDKFKNVNVEEEDEDEENEWSDFEM